MSTRKLPESDVGGVLSWKSIFGMASVCKYRFYSFLLFFLILLAVEIQQQADVAFGFDYTPDNFYK